MAEPLSEIEQTKKTIREAIHCLKLEVAESIAYDVQNKLEGLITAYDNAFKSQCEILETQRASIQNIVKMTEKMKFMT
jgi:hypothetical protein